MLYFVIFYNFERRYIIHYIKTVSVLTICIFYFINLIYSRVQEKILKYYLL